MTGDEGPARVLVGYDGSADADAAVAYGVAEARRRGAELALVYAVDDIVFNSAWGVVFDPEEIKRGAERMLGAVTDEIIAQGVPKESIRAEVLLGAPAATLARLSEWASLVVLGRRSDPSAKAFVGSTAVGVAGVSRCPVIVVCADNVPPAEPYGRIGVAVSSATRGERASLPWALGEARRLGAGLSVLSVCKAPQGRWFGGPVLTAEQQEEAIVAVRERVNALVGAAREGFGDIPVDVDVSYGSPVDVLASRSESLDLLVVEVQPSFPVFAVGGVARGVMTHARCPVALLRMKDSRGASA